MRRRLISPVLDDVLGQRKVSGEGLRPGDRDRSRPDLLHANTFRDIRRLDDIQLYHAIVLSVLVLGKALKKGVLVRKFIKKLKLLCRWPHQSSAPPAEKVPI